MSPLDIHAVNREAVAFRRANKLSSIRFLVDFQQALQSANLDKWTSLLNRWSFVALVEEGVPAAIVKPLQVYYEGKINLIELVCYCEQNSVEILKAIKPAASKNLFGS